MTDEEMKWSNATGKMAEFVFRIELYTQGSVGRSALGWELRRISRFGKRGREHYTVSRYGGGRALRGCPQCLPAAAAAAAQQE